MRTAVSLQSLTRFLLCSAIFLCLSGLAAAQQDTDPIRGNAGQASQPSVGHDATSTTNTPTAGNGTSAGTTSAPANKATPASDDNPYNPYVEPPPLPKSKTTLIGGVATSVDKVRNRLTIQPFGKGTKVKVVLDERSHIYRDGTETTILGVHKGDHVYADTMLDGSKVFVRNLRVVTETSLAEVRGQVIAADLGTGKVRVKDELSSQPVTFSVNNSTKYSSFRGEASARDLQAGSLIDVQFSPDRTNRDVAQEVIVLAKTGENYIFSGTVTNVDLRAGTLALDNQSDDQNYEIRFDPATIANKEDLKVGSEVTARTVFDGKAYKANNVHVEQTSTKNDQGEQPKDQPPKEQQDQ